MGYISDAWVKAYTYSKQEIDRKMVGIQTLLGRQAIEFCSLSYTGGYTAPTNTWTNFANGSFVTGVGYTRWATLNTSGQGIIFQNLTGPALVLVMVQGRTLGTGSTVTAGLAGLRHHINGGSNLTGLRPCGFAATGITAVNVASSGTLLVNNGDIINGMIFVFGATKTVDVCNLDLFVLQERPA